jgi:LytR cell envelope-related transcriptional attenuator
VNLGTARVVIIVALVVVGVAVLANGFTDVSGAVGASGGPSGTGSGSVTPSQTPSNRRSSAPSPQQNGVLIMVLNGTDSTGLAADVQDALENKGYVAPNPPGNSPVPGVEQSTVYFRTGQQEDQNHADAQYLAETYLDDAAVQRLGPVFDEIVPNTVTVVVVIGQDYADAHPAGGG